MKDEFKITENYLKIFISNHGRKTFSDLTVKEYHKLAKENNLLNISSIKYITGLNWRDYKNDLLKRSKNQNVLQKFIEGFKWKFKM